MEGKAAGRKQRKRGREIYSFLSHYVAVSEGNENLTFVIAV